MYYAAMKAQVPPDNQMVKVTMGSSAAIRARHHPSPSYGTISLSDTEKRQSSASINFEGNAKEDEDNLPRRIGGGR